MKPFRPKKQKTFPQLPFVSPAARNSLSQGNPFLLKISPGIDLNSVPRSLPTLHSIPQDYLPSTRQPFMDLNILGHPPSIAKRPVFPTFVQCFQAGHLLTFYAFVFIDVICSDLRRFSPSRAETADRDPNSLALGLNRHWSMLFILIICQCVCFFP